MVIVVVAAAADATDVHVFEDHLVLLDDGTTTTII